MVNKKLGKLAHSSGKDSKDDKTALQISPGIFPPCEAGLNPRSPGSRHSPRWLLSSPPSLPDKKDLIFLFQASHHHLVVDHGGQVFEDLVDVADVGFQLGHAPLSLLQVLKVLLLLQHQLATGKTCIGL